MNGKFYEQLGGITGIFEQWGVCERTVVLCALARRLPWSGLKMLQRCVEDALIRETVADCEQLERDANDETLLANLLAVQNDKSTDEALAALEKLVSLVPLSSASAAILMVRAVPTLVQRCLTTSSMSCPLARRLLTYLLVHPALVNLHHHQRTLTECLRYLENNLSDNSNSDEIWPQGDETIDTNPISNSNIWGTNGSSFRRTIGKNIEFRSTFDSLVDQYNSDLQESFSKNGRDVDISIDEDRLHFDATIAQPKSQRSNSLTPPTSNFMSSSAENLSEEPLLQKPRSFSLSSEHSLCHLKPIGVFGTTGSETRLDVLRSHNGLEPGMCMVGPWLKSLRLHKYIWLFSNITYDQMMAIDEEYLEKLGVTLGARHKLVLSIARVRERGEALGAAAAGDGVVTLHALRTVRAALRAPLHHRHAQHIVTLLDRVSRELLSNGSGPVNVSNGRRDSLEDDDNNVDPISLHCWLVEKALQHPSFQQAPLSEQLRGLRYRLPPRLFYHRLGEMPHSRMMRHTRYRGGGGGGGGRGWGGGARGGRHHPPGHLDALCLQVAETAID